MGKRTHLEDIIAMGLLYRKEHAGTELLSYDSIRAFDEAINENLDSMNSTATIGIGYSYPEVPELYVMQTDENGNTYAAIKQGADLTRAWNIHIGCLPLDIIIASQMPNALEAINLKPVSKKLLPKSSD